MKITTTVLAVMGLTFCLLGCAQKPTSPENIRSLAAIRTACSTQSLFLIENAKTQMQKDSTAGVVSPEFEKELSEIFDLAERGEWKEASDEVSRLQRKYKPATAIPHHHDHH